MAATVHDAHCTRPRRIDMRGLARRIASTLQNCTVDEYRGLPV
jgi:hypothetical protein